MSHAIMLDATPVDLEMPMTPEMNLYAYMKQVVRHVELLETEILEHLVAAGTTRGWFPTVAALIERFSDHETKDAMITALRKLSAHRLMVASPEGDRILSIVSGITHEKTAIRAIADDNPPFFLLGAVDALTIAPMLQKTVDIQTKCAVSGAPLRLTIDPHGTVVSSKPTTITAFIPGWDGQASIADTVSKNSFFFENDAALHQWQVTHGDPVGMPLTEDTFRSVGMEFATVIAEYYTRVSVK